MLELMENHVRLASSREYITEQFISAGATSALWCNYRSESLPKWCVQNKIVFYLEVLR